MTATIKIAAATARVPPHHWFGTFVFESNSNIAGFARARVFYELTFSRNNHAHVLDGIDEEFLEYCAIYVNAIDLSLFVTGTAQPKMNQAKMNSIPIAIPPRAEMGRLVKKVKTLLALCDELETSLLREEIIRTDLLKTLVA